jgi:hypothetical protein
MALSRVLLLATGVTAAPTSLFAVIVATKSTVPHMLAEALYDEIMAPGQVHKTKGAQYRPFHTSQASRHVNWHCHYLLFEWVSECVVGARDWNWLLTSDASLMCCTAGSQKGVWLHAHSSWSLRLSAFGVRLSVFGGGDGRTMGNGRWEVPR